MAHEMVNDTIAAISTPAGVGAVGMIRISGPSSKEVLGRVWISSHHPVEKFETHRLYYGKISTVDNVLAVWMAAPHSYTGEDVVEVHCHGGAISTRSVLMNILNAGARPAEPGEFTRRAFLNNRMDLVQAESVADIIGAASERALKIAEEQLSGRLSREVLSFEDELKKIKALVEATIDFPEEDIEMIGQERVHEKIAALGLKLRSLAGTYNEGKYYRDGVKVLIAGKPNVGKSSLLNALLGQERAIVHSLPGTTRDIIEEDIQIDGMVYRFMDTAGIRDADCEIEKMGIGLARKKLAEVDLVLIVLDAENGIGAEDAEVVRATNGLKRMFILNKIDVRSNTEVPSFIDGMVLKMSVKTGLGLEGLKDELHRFVTGGKGLSSEGVIVTNLRHKRLLDLALSSLEKASFSAKSGESAEFIALHLQVAMDALGDITGRVTSDDVLNEIFSKFCIGK